MPTYKVTPFAMTEDYFRTANGFNISVSVNRSDYEKRKAIEFDARDMEAACDIAWERYQNLGTHRTPDGGRSLMVGDILAVRQLAPTQVEVPTYFVVKPMGFDRALTYWATTGAPSREY